MKHYIVDYEMWLGPTLMGWGNCNVSTSGPDDSGALLKDIIKNASEKSGLDGVKIRVTGVFKL